MAESSKQSAGLDKQLLGAKNEPGKESKRKRKRSKKAARAPSKETLGESQLKNQESENAVDIKEDSKLNTEETCQTDSANDESETANISKEFNSPDNEKMTTEEIKQEHGNGEECMNKDVQQDPDTIQEQGSEERESNSEQAKQDDASSSKKGNLAFQRSKNMKFSISKSSADEDKHPSDPSGETTAVNTMTVEGNTKKTCEQQVDKAGATKFETSPSTADNANKDASKFPEGIQETSLSKSNKGKKLKQLASFGRNKKKYEIAVKLDESSNETHEENLDDSPGRSERSGSTSRQPFQKTEIVVDSVFKEPVVADNSDFNNENMNDGKDEGTEIEKKRGGKQKKKGPVLISFKRNKSQPKIKPSKSEDEQNTEGNPSKESDDVSATKRGQVEKKKAEFEEVNEGPKANETEAADLKTEETSDTAAEMTQEVSNKEETNSAESKETVATAHEDSNQVTPKKEKKENILRRSLRKLKSPGKVLQGRKKPHEDEISEEVNEDGMKTTDQTDKRASSELEQTAEEQTPAAEDKAEEQCSDHEGTSKAVKRKKSDLKTTTRALKRKKEDGENIIEIEGNEELSETAVMEEKDAQNTFEEANVLHDLEKVEELKDLTEVKEQSVDEFDVRVNKEMSIQKNNMEEREECKQGKVDDEISRESPTRDDTKTEEEVTKEAQEKSQKLMQTVINELIELIKKNEEKKAVEISMQVEEREESVEFSDSGENAVTENQQLTSASVDTGLEREPDEESYDSDLTVVTVERFSSYGSLVEHKTEPNTEDEAESSETEVSRVTDTQQQQETEPNTEDEEIRAIAEGVSSETETSRDTEPPVEKESKPDTEDEEVRAVAEGVPLETETSRDTEPPVENESKPDTEDEEVRAVAEGVPSETETSRDTEPPVEKESKPDTEDEEVRAVAEGVPLETETSRDTEPPVENESKPDTEDEEVRAVAEEVPLETETPRVTKTREDQETEPNAEDKEIGAMISQETKSMEPNGEFEELPAIPEEVSSETEVPRDAELPVENEPKQKTEDEAIIGFTKEVSSGTEAPRDAELPVENKPKQKTEDEAIIGFTEEVSSGTEAPRDAELPVENELKQETEDEEIIGFTEEESSRTETSEANNEDSQVETVPKELMAESRAEHKTEPSTEGEEIHDVSEAGESSEPESCEPNYEDSTVKAVNIKPEELTPESRAEHDTEPGTEGDEVKDFTDAGESSETKTSQVNKEDSKFKGRIVEVKVLSKESEINDDSDEVETITKANELDERKEDEEEDGDGDVGQRKEDSCLMESNQTPSCQNPVEEWIVVHRVDLTEEISRQIKHSLVFNSLRRTTSCCTIM